MHDKMFDHVVNSTMLADLCYESYYDVCPCTTMSTPLTNAKECTLCNGHGVLIMTDFDVVLSDTYFTKQSLTPIEKASRPSVGRFDTVTVDGIEHEFHKPISTHEQTVRLRIETRNDDMEHMYPELLKESEKITAAENAYKDLLEKCELLEKIKK
jgi:hypothetical protein